MNDKMIILLVNRRNIKFILLQPSNVLQDDQPIAACLSRCNPSSRVRRHQYQSPFTLWINTCNHGQKVFIFLNSIFTQFIINHLHFQQKIYPFIFSKGGNKQNYHFSFPSNLYITLLNIL